MSDPLTVPAKTALPIVTGIGLAPQEDGRVHVVLSYVTDTVQLNLSLGPHEEAINHVPLAEGIRQACAAARRAESGLVEARSLADIPAAFRKSS